MRERVIVFLREMAAAMRAQSDRHREHAYERAAASIEAVNDFDAVYARKRLQSIPGIGPKIERKIIAFLEHGDRPAALDAGEAYGDAPFADAPDLHVHTTWSDGSLDIRSVVEWASMLGAPAVGITDHSESLRIARGLSPMRMRAQWREIEVVQQEHPEILILRGSESDILRDGKLDHPDEILVACDFVIGSLHSHLKLDRAAQTARVLAALDNEHMTVLGHPTTRIPGRRPPADLDLDRIFEKASRQGIAMEVNGNPGRLDLDVPLARAALDAGCKLACSSDGHSAKEMLSFARARSMAQEAGAKETDLVNYEVLPERALRSP